MNTVSLALPKPEYLQAQADTDLQEALAIVAAHAFTQQQGGASTSIQTQHQGSDWYQKRRSLR